MSYSNGRQPHSFHTWCATVSHPVPAVVTAMHMTLWDDMCQGLVSVDDCCIDVTCASCLLGRLDLYDYILSVAGGM